MIQLPMRLADRISPEPNTGCWLWTSWIRGGYGMIREGGRGTKVLSAHRYVYEMLNGPIPSGLTLDHLCRITSCVNPDHLEPVTQYVNNVRGTSPLMRKLLQTHCWRGHELNGANLHVSKQGFRSCKTCNNDRNRRRYAEGYSAPCRTNRQRVAHAATAPQADLGDNRLAAASVPMAQRKDRDDHVGHSRRLSHSPSCHQSETITRH